MTWLWAADKHPGFTALSVDIPAGTTAFINGGSENHLWGRAYRTEAAIEQRAAAEFAATALVVAAATLGPGFPAGDKVTVLGDGMLAYLIRSLLPRDVLAEPSVTVRPTAVRLGDPDFNLVDTTGSPDVLAQAVRVLPRLGRLVLAAPPSSAEVRLATYRDIHVRGLSLIGVPWAGGISGHNPADSRLLALMETALMGMSHVRRGEPVAKSLLYVLDEGTDG